MAAPDPGQSSLSAEELQDERFIAALCRNARLQNEEIHKKRKQLRKEIRVIEERSDALEGRYWQEYQTRLAHIAEANSRWSTRKWASAFGANEKEIADALGKRQDKLREEARLKREDLATLDAEFWGAWRKHVDFMRGLTPLPLSSGSTPAATLPGVAPQYTDNQAGSKGKSTIQSTNTQKQNVSGKSSAASQSLSKMSTTATKAASQGLMGDAVQPAQLASPLGAPTPLSYASSPDPNAFTAINKQGHQLRSSTAAASPAPAEKDNNQKASSSGPLAMPLTPKSAFAAIQDQGESAQEPADNAQSANQHEAEAAGSQSNKASAAADPAKASPLSLPKLITPQNQDGDFVGVTDPVVGEIYKGFYKDDNYQGWWMCTPLPWDAWEREIGIKYSFQQADLFKDLPDCYTTDRVRARGRGRRMKSIITGWKKGFEAGGPRARERVFPVLFFDDVPGEPGNFKFPDSPEKIFTFNKRALNALPAEWVAAADLRLPGADVDSPVRGRETAERFRERVRARRALQAKKMSSTPKKTRTGPSALSSSPLEASSIRDLSSAVEDTSREDIEMADAESLSGATAVDDTAGQPDLWGTPQASPTAKTIPTEKTAAPNGSAKGWRCVVLGQEP